MLENIEIKGDVCWGRPNEKRTEVENGCYDLLDGLGIKYQRLDHDVTATIEACDDVSRKLGISICKNLFLCNAQKTKFYLLMMPGDKVFKTKELSKQINSSRLSFAGEEFMMKFLGVEPGSVTVLGLMNDKENNVRLIIDKDVVAADYVGCHPCKNTSSLKIATEDLLNKILPAIGHEAEFVQL